MARTAVDVCAPSRTDFANNKSTRTIIIQFKTVCHVWTDCGVEVVIAKQKRIDDGSDFYD